MPPSSRALTDLCWRLMALLGCPKEARTDIVKHLMRAGVGQAAPLIYVLDTSLDARILCGNTSNRARSDRLIHPARYGGIAEACCEQREAH